MIQLFRAPKLSETIFMIKATWEAKTEQIRCWKIFVEYKHNVILDFTFQKSFKLAFFIKQILYCKQGCIRRKYAGNPAIEPAPSGKNPAIDPLQAKKNTITSSAQRVEIFFGAFGAEKHPKTLYFRVFLRFYALLVQLQAFLAQN